MFDVPLDAWYVWLGLIAASATALGVASAVPGTPAPDAAGAAETVDRTAVSQYDAVGEHPLSNAEAVRIGADSMSLRGPGGTAHEPIGHGPVTPVDDGPLRRVLLGEPPDRVFRSPSALAAAAAGARDAEPTWRETDHLLVRTVTWENVDVTLVG